MTSMLSLLGCLVRGPAESCQQVASIWSDLRRYTRASLSACPGMLYSLNTQSKLITHAPPILHSSARSGSVFMSCAEWVVHG